MHSVFNIHDQPTQIISYRPMLYIHWGIKANYVFWVDWKSNNYSVKYLFTPSDALEKYFMVECHFCETITTPQTVYVKTAGLYDKSGKFSFCPAENFSLSDNKCPVTLHKSQILIRATLKNCWFPVCRPIHHFAPYPIVVLAIFVPKNFVCFYLYVNNSFA